MKKGKIIGLSIGFVLLGLISTIFMPFTSVSTKCNNEYENVIGDNLTNGDALLTDIGLLGAHDAFSSGINYKSNPDTNGGSLYNNKVLNALGKGLIVRVSRAQVASAEEMLNAGVRYFDARITLVDNEYYTMHGYLSNKLEYYLQDVVDFLGDHPKEYVIFDIQHFNTPDGNDYKASDDEYEKLFTYIDSVKNDNGQSLLDFANYNSLTDKLGELTYNTLTTNGTTGGALILAKTAGEEKAYWRDDDGEYETTYYETIRSVWHKENITSKMIDNINYECDYIKENVDEYKDVLIVNQAQKTAFLTSAKIIPGVLQWSLLDMANSFNKKLVSDKDRFMNWLQYMPILMVDYATSNTGSFNELANKYIAEYNQNL